MDEEMRRYLDDMMRQIDDQFERVLDGIKNVHTDLDITGGHAALAMFDSATLSQRVSKLENEIRKQRPQG
jgi:polyhydroxyalkanoate synthesis regulator phasin